MFNVHSLKTKITAVLVLLMSFAIVLEVFYLVPALKRYHIADAKRYQQELAEQIAANFDFSFNQAIREIENIAKLPEIVSMEKEKLDFAIARVNKVTQFFNYYFVLDKTGKWISYPGQEFMVGMRIPEHNMGWVRKTFRENRTIFLNVVVTNINTLVSGFSTPIIRNGEAVGLLRGVIVTSAENTVLSTILNSNVGESGYAFVVGANGWLIAHPKIKLRVDDFKVYDYKEYPPVEGVIKGQRGVAEYEFRGRPWLAAYAPIKATNWGVVVQQPLDDILDNAKKISGIVYLISLVVFITSVVILIGVVGYALRPLNRLGDAIKSRKFRDDLAFSKGEIGQIAKAFHSLYSELSDSEEELRKMNVELEERVEQRTGELEQANMDLEKEVAERRYKEEMLRMTSESLESLILASPMTIMALDREGKVTVWNPEAERTFGWARDEVIGRFNPMVSEEKVEEFHTLRERVLNGEWLTGVEARRKKKDGSSIDISISAAPLYDKKKNITGIIAIIEDITERKKAEKDLQLFASALRQTVDGVQIVGLDGRIVYSNEAVEKMYGYSNDELIGKRVTEMSADADFGQSVIMPAVKEYGEWSGEAMGKHKDGRIFPVWLTISLVRKNSGEPLAMVGIVRDITEQKTVEGQIKTSLREKEVLLREVHHRVKNNMQIISSLLKLQSKYIEDPKVLDLVQESNNRIRAMALIHENLYKSGDLTNIDFKNYVVDLLYMIERTFSAASQEVSIKINIDAVSLNTDTAIPCGLIINELVSNCFEHAFPGNEGGEIEVSLHEEGDSEFILKVKDNGVGLPADMDFRHSNSLGLELVTALAEEQLGGNIEIKSREGTELIITFKEIKYRKRI